jgi:excisionase family DNA binding protein
MSANAKVRTARPAALTASVGETAALLGISASLVRLQIKNAQIRAFRIGGRILISRAEINRLLAGSFSTHEAADSSIR